MYDCSRTTILSLRRIYIRFQSFASLHFYRFAIKIFIFRTFLSASNHITNKNIGKTSCRNLCHVIDVTIQCIICQVNKLKRQKQNRNTVCIYPLFPFAFPLFFQNITCRLPRRFLFHNEKPQTIYYEKNYGR